MKLILKNVITFSFFLFSGAIVTGCMLMMPLMMVPMMPLMMVPTATNTSQSSGQDRELLIRGAVSDMVVNRSDYTLIEFGRIETDERILSKIKFKETIANQISASGQLVVIEPGHSHTPGDITSGSPAVAAVLDAELLRLQSQDRLEFKLKDANSGQIIWEKRFYSLQTSSASPHSQ